MDLRTMDCMKGKHSDPSTFIDDSNRESLLIAIDTSLTSERVIRELDKLIQWRGKPEYLRIDNGLELIAQAH